MLEVTDGRRHVKGQGGTPWVWYEWCVVKRKRISLIECIAQAIYKNKWFIQKSLFLLPKKRTFRTWHSNTGNGRRRCRRPGRRHGSRCRVDGRDADAASELGRDGVVRTWQRVDVFLGGCIWFPAAHPLDVQPWKSFFVGQRCAPSTAWMLRKVLRVSTRPLN